MTLAELAKGLHVSTMTIYRRLKQRGLNIDDLRDSSGGITAEGATVIAAMFDAPRAPQGATEGTTGAQHDTQQGATCDTTRATGATVGDLDAATAARVEVLQAKLDAAADTITRLEGERDRLAAQLAAMTAALEREQSDRAQERLLLTSAPATSTSADERPRRGLLWWLRR